MGAPADTPVEGGPHVLKPLRSHRRLALVLAWLSVGAVWTGCAWADPAPFDLAGPTLEVKVTRGQMTLPIAEVPNLAAGDQLWIKAALPASQSARYLLVAAFLRGSTNPPPPDWFSRCETWKRRCQQGMTVTVPADAQQVLLFLAPKTSGDFRTLLGAVRGRPGAFVRASQDLNQATLDRSRLQGYLTALRAIDSSDQQATLKEVAPLLARSLAIKMDTKCLDKIPELQVPCLMAGQDSLILNDGHSTSIVEALTSGPATDLAMEASYTPQLSYGYYSPYIASVLDIVRIMGSLHSAQYQYIPALAAQYGDQLALTLNTPPSFHNPRSVLVTALPAVEPAQLPPLHAVDPKQMFCARKTSLVLPVEGAPLVFSTAYARDLALRLSGQDGRIIDLPTHADAEQGGFVVDTAALGKSDLGDDIRATLHGHWGFSDYDGPSFQLVSAQPRALSLVPSDHGDLIVGREDVVHLQAVSVGCIEDVMLEDASGKQVKADWKTVKLNEVEVKLPLQEAKPGSLTLVVTQYGSKSEPLQLHAFSAAGRLDGFTIRAGETQGTLRGSRLDQVAGLTLKGIHFVPSKLTSLQGTDELTLVAQVPTRAAAPGYATPGYATAGPAAGGTAASSSVATTPGATLVANGAAGTTPVASPAAPPLAAALKALKEGDSLSAQVTLKDGRVFDLDTLVAAPRPSVTLIGKSVRLSSAGGATHIQLAAADELPQDATLTFSVRAANPAQFSRDEQIEVATDDESFSTTLGLANGGVTLEDAQVAVATLDPTRAFGSSAFGPLQFRVVVGGIAGDWQPLVTLVRLPRLQTLTCPATPDLACKLSGSNLFLLDAVSADTHFEHPTEVPDGFPGYSLPVPHPGDGQLYVRLRDDPSVVNQATLVMETLPPTPTEAARLAAAHSPDHGAAGGGTEAAAPLPTATPDSSGASDQGQPPVTTAPGVTAPGTTAPAATAPSATAPSATAPGTGAASPEASAAWASGDGAAVGKAPAGEAPARGVSAGEAAGSAGGGSAAAAAVASPQLR
jgi:hypothetical protein